MSDPQFLMTKEYRRFVEFCEACRRYRYIGICYGPPGVGKTISARQYTNWGVVGPAIQNGDPQSTHPYPEIADSRTLFYTAPVVSTPSRMLKEIHHLRVDLSYFLQWSNAKRNEEEIPSEIPNDPTELVIVDEADRLKLASLEQLRDIYDQDHIGLILIGMPGLERRLARYPQLYSRVGFAHEFRILSTEEMRFILEHKWSGLGLKMLPDDFTDEEAVAAVIRITNGNFRLVHRLFTQIERILEINEMRTITKEVVEAARESLVIGLA